MEFQGSFEATSAKFGAPGTISKLLDALPVSIDSQSRRTEAQRIAAEYLFLTGPPCDIRALDKNSFIQSYSTQRFRGTLGSVQNGRQSRLGCPLRLRLLPSRVTFPRDTKNLGIGLYETTFLMNCLKETQVYKLQPVIRRAVILVDGVTCGRRDPPGILWNWGDV